MTRNDNKCNRQIGINELKDKRANKLVLVHWPKAIEVIIKLLLH